MRRFAPSSILAAALLCLLASTPALAQGDPAAPPEAAAVAEARKRFSEGQALFEKGDLKGAVEEFKEAYRLTRNPLLLYNIGFVYDKLGDEPIALHYYNKFIDEAQDSERTHAQLAEASARATTLKAKLGLTGTEEPPASQPTTQPAPPEPRELGHEPIDQAPPGKPVDVVASIPRDAAWTVTLHYRAAGIEQYQATPMKPLAPGGTELVARIPGGALRGTALQYYVAARDPDGKLASSSGRAQTPHLIYIDPEAPPHTILPSDAEAGPVPPEPPAPPKIVVPDKPTRPLVYAKWATSAGAAVLIGTGIGLHLAARDYSETLEAESIKSNDPSECTEPPCRVFSQPRKNLENTGKRYERWSNLTMVTGLLAAAGAGVLWYLDWREVAAMPVVAPGTYGAAAVVRF